MQPTTLTPNARAVIWENIITINPDESIVRRWNESYGMTRSRIFKSLTPSCKKWISKQWWYFRKYRHMIAFLVRIGRGHLIGVRMKAFHAQLQEILHWQLHIDPTHDIDIMLSTIEGGEYLATRKWFSGAIIKETARLIDCKFGPNLARYIWPTAPDYNEWLWFIETWSYNRDNPEWWAGIVEGVYDGKWLLEQPWFYKNLELIMRVYVVRLAGMGMVINVHAPNFREHITNLYLDTFF